MRDEAPIRCACTKVGFEKIDIVRKVLIDRDINAFVLANAAYANRLSEKPIY